MNTVNLSFGQWVLIINALLFAGIGIAFVTAPAEMITNAGLVPQTATALTELRAFYGSFEIAVAAFLLYCAWYRPWTTAGLAFLAIAASGLVIGRSLGLWIDGLPQPLTIKLMLVEMVIALVALYGWYREV